jgi:hypothetical protein
MAALFASVIVGTSNIAVAQESAERLPARGGLLYQNNFSEAGDVVDWVMEGPGLTEFKDGWMEMHSPEKKFHHVFWCPEDFPDSFIAEWETQNLDPTHGLCIVFFAMTGENGEDIFDSSLPQRDGDFTWYIKDRLNGYHISYYANTPKKEDRGRANLRKNNGFNLVQEGKEGIPARSTDVHQLKLVKEGPRIRMFVDGRKVIDWTDTPENELRSPYGGGKIGFRQMQWTHFRYRNFRVWGVESPAEQLARMKDLPVVHPKQRQWAEPAMGMIATKNSPTLRWPRTAGEGEVYTVRLSRDPRFPAEGTEVSGPLPYALFNPYRTLAAGAWYWQVKSGDGPWSDSHHFLITEESQDWDPPSPEAFLAAVPRHHPRVLVDAGSLATFRARARGTPEAQRILASAEQVFEREPPSEANDILNIRGDDKKKTDKLQKDASKEIGQTLYAGVGPLLKAYVLTGNPRFAEEALRWGLEAASWDPNGVTRINDFGDSRIMLSLAQIYDTLHDRLSERERLTLRDAAAARANNFFRDYINNKETAVLSNHVWQHILHYYFDTSIALMGDHPDAEKWLTYIYEMFLARAPVLGGKDGGWVHGLAYFRMNFETLLDIPWRIREYTGFDFFRHTPWYRENTNYFLYGFPPGSAGTGFADNAHDLPEPRGDYLAYADALSRIVQNPYAAWYRDRITQVTGELTPHYQDYWEKDYVTDANAAIRLEDTAMLQWARLKYLSLAPAAQPESPADLPKARVFEGVGLVTMHSQPLDQLAEGNLFLAMRASPYGTYSHMLSDNNTFNMVYGGDRLFYHTGYKVAMSAPHRQLYYKHTQSHNGILINGEGQPYSTEAYAWIENFLTGDRLSYAVGNASNAYDSAEEKADPGLNNFKRHVLMLRPDIVVVYDELDAEKPAAWSYLLHSYYEMTMKPDQAMLSTSNRAGRAVAHLYGSSLMNWAVTDEYPVPAENWRGITDDSGELKEYTNNAWHFRADTAEAKSIRFLAFYQVRPHGLAEDFDFNEIRRIDGSTFRLGNWRVRAQMDPDQPARIEILNTLDGVAFASSGTVVGPGELAIETGSPASAKLAEQADGQWIIRQSQPRIPPGVEAGLRYFEGRQEKETR